MSSQPAEPLVTFAEVARAVRSTKLPACDAVVGIGSGGIVPAALIAFELDSPLYVVWLNYRAPDNQPQYSTPRILQEFDVPTNLERILLVDDVAVTGKTLHTARTKLRGVKITTVVLKGKADIVLFPELSTCARWPWHPNNNSTN